MKCQVCGESTAVITSDGPDEDWEYAVALNMPSVGDAEDAIGFPAEDDPYWWRAEEMYRAGFMYEQAMVLAGTGVDLHDACQLVKRAGADLAFQILS